MGSAADVPYGREMRSVEVKQSGAAEDAVLAGARAGDEVLATARAADEVLAAVRADDDASFGALLERCRRELHVHCYRMVGSFEDAEDLVQETFLRAWRKRESFQGRSTFRAWLYRIATNACLDQLDRHPRTARSRRATASGAAPPSEIAWLQPYPDHLLERIAPSDDEPDAAVVAKETIELAFLVAVQHLPPRQRAVLILRDVLGWSANDAASLLDASVASANSALQRARTTLKRHLPARRMDWSLASDPSRAERELVQRYIDATDRGDSDAIVTLLHEDVRFSMPPEPGTWVGRDSVVASWVEGGFGSTEFGDLRCKLTAANMQPAVACYCRHPGATEYRALGLDVLRVDEGAIAEIITFQPDVFPMFGLPPTLRLTP